MQAYILYIAAKYGITKIVELYLEYIQYIDDINYEYRGGLTAIEVAAMNGHFEIVNYLLPFSTDLEYQSMAKMPSDQTKTYIKDQIKKFSEQTGENEVVARSFLSVRSWKLHSAVRACRESFFKNVYSISKDSRIEKFKSMVKQFQEVTNVEENVAQCYVLQNTKYRMFCDKLQNKTPVEQSIDIFTLYRHNLSHFFDAYSEYSNKIVDIQNKIEKFVEKTKTSKTKAREYLPKHNWDVETAVESFNKDQFEEFQKSLLNSYQSQHSNQQ